MPSSHERWLKTPLAAFRGQGRTLVVAPGHSIALFYVDGEVHAFDNACPHEGNPLVEGDVLGRTLVCAFHAWRFDLETGACLFGDEPVRRYPVEQRGGEVWIDLGEPRS
jgi:nitrite reductase/ring-hydroxylating ferredoxin subunit